MNRKLFKEKLDAVCVYKELKSIPSQERSGEYLSHEDGGFIVVDYLIDNRCSHCDKATEIEKPVLYKKNHKTGNHWLGRCKKCKRHFT